MAIIKDMLRRVQVLVDDTIDTSTLIDWFNQGQDSILDILYIPTKQIINRDIVSGCFILPANYNTDFELIVPDDVDSSTIEFCDGTILFDGSDDPNLTSITVKYNRLPLDIINNPDFSPEIPKQFHDVYIMYATMMAMHPEEEPERYAQYEKDYTRMRLQIQRYMGRLRKGKTVNWTVIR